MRFLAIYRASFYLMLTFATLVLSIDATDDIPFAMLYPLVVAVAGVVAFVTVDRNPRLSPSRNVASLLAVASGLLSYFEYKQDPNLILLAAAHWLVYLQLIKMFLPKTIEDDWFLFLLGLVQVLVGGVMSQSDKVGIALFTWALLSLWVLTLFALHREALRLRVVPTASPAPDRDPVVDRSEPYRGLVDLPFLFSTARVAATTLALGGLIFLAMPRKSSVDNPQSGGSVGKHLSGFDDEVQLGQLGEILENDSVVMSVELFDREGNRHAPEAGRDYRWRGVSMDRYSEGRWRRPRPHTMGYSPGVPTHQADSRIIRQMIRLEPTDSPVLFSLRPIIQVGGPDRRNDPEINKSDGSLFRGEPRAVSYDYEVESEADADLPQSGESYPSIDYRKALTTLPDDFRRQVREIALARVGHIPADDLRGRAAELERWLRDSGEFRYTLQMEVTDRDVDPVVDFLVNRKSGHCEYFASALTLLLRSIDIPARMINGFKGGDYNAMGGVITVRQKHAHSWVETLVGRTEGVDGLPIWSTLDPTPADQRDASVARVGGIAGEFRQVTDFIRFIWVFYIVGFNSERQDRFLYKPIRDLIDEARYGFELIYEKLQIWLHFPSVESFFSFRGFAVSFAVLLLLVGLARLGTWLVPRLYRRLTGTRSERSSGSDGVAFYRRLLQLLAEYGLDRPPAETPREFARRAAVFLSGHGSGTEAVADVPPLIVDAFYRIRYGEHTLGEDDLAHVIARLDALESRMHPQKA